MLSFVVHVINFFSKHRALFVEIVILNANSFAIHYYFDLLNNTFGEQSSDFDVLRIEANDKQSMLT